MFTISYESLADSVEIEMNGSKPRLSKYSQNLMLIGTGRSAFVFKIKDKDLALKVYFPDKRIAFEEAAIYRKLQHIDYYPSLYEAGKHYIVIDFIEGHTMFQCLQKGIFVPEVKVKEISKALKMAEEAGLNPADIHLKNIIITSGGGVKVIDVARFMQKEKDNQWKDLERAYFQMYSKKYFPKKIPTYILNFTSFVYKKRYLPKPIRVLFNSTE